MRMNQTRLAEMADVSRASVSRALNNKPPFGLAQKLGKITAPIVTGELWYTGTTKQKKRALRSWFEDEHLRILRERDKVAA